MPWAASTSVMLEVELAIVDKVSHDTIVVAIKKLSKRDLIEEV